jgi:hypothetical protein
LTVLGFGIFFALLLGAGSVAALNLLRDEAVPSEPTPDKEQAAVETADKTQPEKPEDATAQGPVGGGSDAQAAQPTRADPQQREGPSPEEDTAPAPGYNLIRSPDGALTAEAPQGWGVQTGSDSEGEGSNWSYYAGNSLASSITTAGSLEAWYAGEASGAYLAASKTLAQYSDYELTHSLLHERKADNCTTGPYEDLGRSGYTGTIQTWYDCDGIDATTFSVAAAPEGRQCVVVLAARINSEADRQTIEHLFDNFEVDCERVREDGPASSTASASASTPPEATAPPSATASPDPCYDGILTPSDEECPVKEGPPNDWEEAYAPSCEEVFGPEGCPPVRGDGYNDDGSWHGPCPEGQIAVGEGCHDPNASATPSATSPSTSDD